MTTKSRCVPPVPFSGRDPISPLPGLYIHVPFCQTKCPYCDFYSIVDHQLISGYLDALMEEVTLRRKTVHRADTIYFGGGTPSILTPGQVEKVLEQIYACFSIAADSEITLEVNPGTVTQASLAGYRRAGINRLNIGLQSINDETLTFLGRIHTAQQGIDTYYWAREAGFENVGLDLIYGVPGQTTSRWETEMAQVVAMAPAHLSCYSLTLEAETPLANKVRNGLIQPLEEKTSGDLFLTTVEYLNRNGYPQYEISNFARRAATDTATTTDTIDQRSRHNRKYWMFAPYLGFGPSAHSYLGNTRWWNHRSVKAYLDDICSGRLPVSETETLTRDQQMMEYIYLGLRQTDGIDTSDFRSRFKEDFFAHFGPTIDRLESEKLVEKSSQQVRLTARGMLFLDSVVERMVG